VKWLAEHVLEFNRSKKQEKNFETKNGKQGIGNFAATK
jgi:hypothetical protein